MKKRLSSKLLPVLLVFSLAANATLIITRLGKSFAPFNAARTIASQNTATADAHAATPAASLPKLSDNAELATLREKLIAAGIPADIAREVMRAMLWKPLHDRQRAMLESKNAGKPYWQQTAATKKQLTAAERAELRALSEQIEARAAGLLGDDFTAKAAARYTFLPAGKAAALSQLNRDYGNMHDGIADEISLFRLPSDDIGRKLLRQEHRRDLEAILSPAELAEYDLRHSPAATNLRKRFAALPDSTEAEYKAAFDIAQTLTAAKNAPAAQTLAAQQLRDLLGPDRYAAFLRANDNDYTALQGAAARFDIPPATVGQVYGLRDQAVSLSRQIAADKNLSARDKQQALKTLATQLHKDVRASLGDEIGNAYLDKNMPWLNTLAAGNTLSTTPTGKITAKPIPKDSKTLGNTGPKQQKPGNKTAKDKGPKKGK
jgi:hypothetical protein